MSTFTQHALEKMLDLFCNHDHEVGSQLKKAVPDACKDYQATDCITYVLNVLTHAFQQDGKAAMRRQKRKASARMARSWLNIW